MPSRTAAACNTLLYATLIAVLWFCSPALGRLVRDSQTGMMLLTAGVTVVWVVLNIGLIRCLCSLRLSFAASMAAFLASLAVLALIVRLRVPQPAGSLAVALAPAFLGCGVSYMFRDANILLPVCLVSPLVDYWTVKFGPVAAVIHGTPEVLEQVSAHVANPHGLRPLALVGAGDFLFMAIFLAAAERFRMSPGRTAVYWSVLVSLALLLVMFSSVFQSIGMPGLVVIGLGFVAANIRHFRLTKAEMATTAALAVTLCAILIYIESRS